MLFVMSIDSEECKCLTMPPVIPWNISASISAIKYKPWLVLIFISFLQFLIKILEDESELISLWMDVIVSLFDT